MRCVCDASWCGLCYENAKGRANHSGHRGYRRPRPFVLYADVGAWMKKPDRLAPGAVPRAVGRDEAFAKKYPRLWEHLSEEVWDDGSVRATSTLFLFVDGGKWKCMLKDRSLGLVVFFTADDMVGVLSAAEKALAADSVDWRPDRPAARRGRS